jgi:phenylpropionate dioxygenase-like ring-hydroxylating dioxygenase large terminal subunit
MAGPVDTSPTSASAAAGWWYVACRASELRDRPLGVTLHGRPLVLFRAEGGRPGALEDRCPHRNAPLSAGRLRGGALECGYHGWRFDAAGACLAVPGLAAAPDARATHATAFACLEQDGHVWVASRPGAAPAGPPFRFPHLGAPGYTTVLNAMVVRATLQAALENVLDVPHTAFLHRGLFRGGRAPREIEVVVRRWADRAEAEFVGEPVPSGLAARLLAPGGGLVRHFDRFLLPSVAQVEYRLGDASHVVVSTVMTPVDAERTRLFSAVTFRLPVPGWLVRPVLTPIARRILAQDAWMLGLVSDNVRRFGGERFASTEADVLGPQLARLLRHAERDTAAEEPGRPESVAGRPDAPEHEHRVRMRL